MKTDQLRSSRSEGSPLPLWGMVPTPFVESLESIDAGSLRRLAGALVGRGCTDLVALGVIAEPDCLTPQERLEVLDVLLGASLNVPVIAGVLGMDFNVAVREASAFGSEFGGSLSALMVPVSVSDAGELRRRLITLHRASGLPLVIQDLPRSTGVSIGTKDLLATLDGLDFIQAIKCESMPTFTRIRQLSASTNVRLLSGYGGIGLIDDLRAGAAGMACGISRPEVMASALEAWCSGEEHRAAALVGVVSGLINYETQPGQSIAIRKEHWRRQGVIDHGGVRNPTPPWSADLDPHSRFYGFV